MNGYLDNKAIYKGEVNTFSDMTDEQFETFFAPHKEAGKQAGIRIHQMQIPYTFTKTRENKPSTDWDGFIKGLKDIEFTGVINFVTIVQLQHTHFCNIHEKICFTCSL